MFRRNHFVWNEPWFFSWRVRHWHSWLALVAMLLVVGVVAAVALFFLIPARPPMFKIVGLSLIVVGLLWAVIDGPLLRRSAILDAKALYVNGEFGKFSRHERYPLTEIKLVVIRTAEDLKWPFPVLFIATTGEESLVGINRGISLPRLASALHGLGVRVQLEGWDPHSTNEFQRTFTVEVADPSAVRPTGQMEPLPPGSPKLWTPVGLTIAIIKQCWAGAIAIGVIIASGVYIYRNWGNIGLVQVVLAIVIPIAVLYVVGVFTDRFATASTTATLIKHSTDQIRRRSGAILQTDTGIHPVEVFREDQFANMVQKIHEMGFIQVDTPGRQLLFEGKAERWKLPADCLRKVTIEEVQTGAQGDSQTGRTNFYVVFDFDTIGKTDLQRKTERFGFRCGKRDYGDFNDVKRAQQAIELFELISPLVVTNGGAVRERGTEARNA